MEFLDGQYFLAGDLPPDFIRALFDEIPYGFRNQQRTRSGTSVWVDMQFWQILDMALNDFFGIRLEVVMKPEGTRPEFKRERMKQSKEKTQHQTWETPSPRTKRVPPPIGKVRRVEPELDKAYAVLGLASSAPDEVVSAAFKALAMKHHPDRGGSADAMARINKAYELVVDARRK